VSSPEVLHVGLSPTAIVLARSAGRWRPRPVAWEKIDCGTGTSTGSEAPWEASLAALARTLGSEARGARRLQVVLAGRLVRWQLLSWRPELKGPRELATYAALRFRETYGRCAEAWQVSCSPQPPGQAIPACAVDAGLVAGLGRISQAAGLRLGRVTPYFAAAFDNWRGQLGRQAAWFGLVESDCLSLGLLRDGAWLGLRTERLGRHWADALTATRAQLAIATGLDASADVPLYLAGSRSAAAPAEDLPHAWLCPRTPAAAGQDDWRLALGV